MMMLAVMYGMIPRAKIEKLSKPPPENRFRKPERTLRVGAALSWSTARGSTPGTRIAIPNR